MRIAWPLLILVVVQSFLAFHTPSVKAPNSPDIAGRYITICTMQGLEQVFIADDTQTAPLNAVQEECPACTLSSLQGAAIANDPMTVFPARIVANTPSDPDFNKLSNRITATPIRAPPSF